MNPVGNNDRVFLWPKQKEKQMKFLFIITLIRFLIEWISKDEKTETTNDVKEQVLDPAAHQLR